MALTLDTTGSVTALAISDSTCVEANGTYDLIFTGANTTPATGTYTILGNVITAVTLTSGGSGYAAAPTVATQTADGAVTATFYSLDTIQDSSSRHPLVEIVSSQRTADIPFDGSFLTSETFNEYGPNVIPHSTGRLCAAYCYGPNTDHDSGIKYVYTDVSRTEFTEVTIELYPVSGNRLIGVSLCEMTGGNIGLVYLANDATGHVYRLLRRIITVTGTAVSNAEIANWSHDTFTSDPWVTTLTTKSYLMVYGKKSGSNYYIYKRTSSNFVTWSAESALSIAGLTATWRLSNPSILKISTGDLWLFFDVLESTDASGNELTNIYFTTSADSGSTWASATKMTAYDTYDTVGSHPVGIQKVANQMHMLFTQKMNVLHMTESATGWPTGHNSVEISWDSVNRKLYAVNLYLGGGSKHLQNVIRIDVDTWAVDKYWDETTTPGFPAFATDGYSMQYIYSRGIQDGHHIVVASCAANLRFIWHLDGESDTITSYYMDTDVVRGVTANVSGCPAGGNEIRHLQVDAANSRIWVILGWIYVGYIDLTETSDYQWHQSFYYAAGGISYALAGAYIDIDSNTLVISAASASFPTWGALQLFDVSTGGLLKSWTYADADFPYYGACRPYIYNGKIYASICRYTSGAGQAAFRGLVQIDTTTFVIKYHRPSYCSDDDHTFNRPAYYKDSKLIMYHSERACFAVFDIVSETWEYFNSTNTPGLGFGNVIANIVYDSTKGLIMTGTYGDGVYLWSDHGAMRQAYYTEGAYSGGAWTFGTAAALCQGYLDYDAGACVGPGSTSSMYVFWTNEDTEAEKSIKWDKDGSSIDISEYITGEVATEQTISGQPARLSFSVSHGHLFDPYNTASLLSPVLKKGRKLALRWGEKISAVDYWQTAGTYFVTGASLSFKRGDYPVMSVEAEDQRCLWTHGHVFATAIYNNLPEDIIEAILYTQANIPYASMSLPAFAGGTLLQMQWIETTLDEILTQICERFGYYFRFDYEGKASARRISNVATIDHTYTDSTKLIQYTPDDKYSDFTNRVTVRGQELDYTQVQFAEEQIETINGTIGWWGCKKDHVIWFSQDHSRRCVYPRMQVIETSVSIPMQLAGEVTEELVECGALDDNKFCTINVEAPNLIAPLINSIAGYVAACCIPDQLYVVGNITIPIGRLVAGSAMMTVSMILGSVANYQFAIHACPLGNIRRSVQGTWNDTEHQTEIDAVVEQVIDDPLCYSAADCTAVATFEGMVAQMQRKRVMIEKIAHLQDEDGDTIRVIHPYSGNNLDLYIASLRRKFKKAEAGGDGYFLDEIEGWVCS
jgi:hypothetical protein